MFEKVASGAKPVHKGVATITCKTYNPCNSKQLQGFIFYRRNLLQNQEYYNYCLKGKDGKAPAMRLGLAKGVVTQEDIIYYKKQGAENINTFVYRLDPVRGFFVGNLLGKLDDTLAAATQPEGATYPPGSIVQLIPDEAMIKHHRGWSTETNDWEFFALDVSKEGTKIKARGTTRVENKFGGNCFGCHRKAKPQWDFICEEGHGCDSLPIPDFLIHLAQRNDPRCD